MPLFLKQTAIACCSWLLSHLAATIYLLVICFWLLAGSNDTDVMAHVLILFGFIGIYFSVVPSLLSIFGVNLTWTVVVTAVPPILMTLGGLISDNGAYSGAIAVIFTIGISLLSFIVSFVFQRSRRFMTNHFIAT